MNDAATEAFVSELKHWRDVRGHSQSALARAMGYHRTYISKIESGQERPTADFVDRAEKALRTGGALLRSFRDVDDHRRAAEAPHEAQQPVRPPTSDGEAGNLVLEHDHARLVYEDGAYRAIQRRRLYNAGDTPVTSYLIRISVDRHPGSPELSNQLYRENPLTWAELNLTASHEGRDPMVWRVMHDRDAFKELWLLFENDDGRFPLYPGETATIEYAYTVSEHKWGQWFQRAVRLPTRLLSVELDFPADLDPAVWGTETTMTAASLPLRTAIRRIDEGSRKIYAWSTDHPPLHARYRLEWKFRANPTGQEGDAVSMSPREAMRSLGIVQDDDPQLRQPTRPFDLPAEAEDARRAVAQLHATMDRVAAVHTFGKGMGLAAPQIGIDRAVALVRTPDGETFTLLNPRVIEESPETDEQYEGCLSFFDVRGMVPRPLCLEVEHQDLDGARRLPVFERGVARLVAHELDHLDGDLYTDRMAPGIEPIPVSEYRGTGKTWHY